MKIVSFWHCHPQLFRLAAANAAAAAAGKDGAGVAAAGENADSSAADQNKVNFNDFVDFKEMFYKFY